MIIAAFVLSGIWDVMGIRTEFSQLGFLGSAVAAAVELFGELVLVGSLFA